jgi:hypothetical protein
MFDRDELPRSGLAFWLRTPGRGPGGAAKNQGVATTFISAGCSM